MLQNFYQEANRMGNGGSSLGKKISEGFNVLGKKMGEGWEATKNFGNQAWNKIKSVPVLGKIAEGIEKYTPIGMAATSALRGIDAAATGGSKLLQGDLKGAISEGTRYGRDVLNQKNPLLEAAKKIPVLGSLASGAEAIASNVPIYGGMSVNTLRSIGNSGLNAVDAFKEGDVKGGFKNLAKGGASYLGSRGGKAGMFGKAVGAVL
jgi:hypothetical protein